MERTTKSVQGLLESEIIHLWVLRPLYYSHSKITEPSATAHVSRLKCGDVHLLATSSNLLFFLICSVHLLQVTAATDVCGIYFYFDLWHQAHPRKSSQAPRRVFRQRMVRQHGSPLFSRADSPSARMRAAMCVWSSSVISKPVFAS